MIQLSLLSDPSDLVAFVSLAVLTIVFGLFPAERVMSMWIRKRREVALIWAIACLHRGAELAHVAPIAVGVHLASAVVAMLAAWTTVRCLIRERHDDPAG